MTALDRRLVHSFSAADDLEIHASLVNSPSGRHYADFREYVPSLKKYGRGLMLPVDALPELHTGLLAAIRAGVEETSL